MPKVSIMGNPLPVVRCVNHDDHLAQGNPLAIGAATTMIPVDGWNAITSIVPPNHTTNTPPSFQPANGIPVKLYVCRICGYVEGYAGIFESPQVWRR